MSKLPKAAFKWAIRHLCLEGDSDLFPNPLELSAFKYQWQDLEGLLANLSLENHVWSSGRRFVVPKGNFAFRSATQLEPLDSLLLAAILKKYGSKLEAIRVPKSEGRVFSYRFEPQSDGRMFGHRNGWREFWKSSIDRASQSSTHWVAVADITDYYNQIYHHVVRRQLDAAGIPSSVGKVLENNFLGATSQGVSRGIPIGPHATHLLAEIALDPIDRSLQSKRLDFCRYVDDFHFFCATKEEAQLAIIDFVESIDKQQRLSLQREKTNILPAEDFLKHAETMLADRPLNEKEAAILEVIRKYSDNSPYDWVSYEEVDEVDLEYLGGEEVTELINLYLDSDPISYSRLGWLLRRLAQVGAPSAVDSVLLNLEKLIPILGDASRYLVRASPNYEGALQECGSKILQLLQLPLVRHNAYLQMVLLSLFSRVPALNHIEVLTSDDAFRDSAVRREVILAAAAAHQSAWVRERKDEFSQSDPWVRRAIVQSMAILPGDEAVHWLQKMRYQLSGCEKAVAFWAFDNKARKSSEKLRLGELNL